MYSLGEHFSVDIIFISNVGENNKDINWWRDADTGDGFPTFFYFVFVKLPSYS